MFRIRLKELREKAGYSQAQLAIKLGVRQSTVGMWENGTNKPKNMMLEKLANMFGVSTDYLLGRTVSEIPSSPDAIRIPVLGTIPAGVPLEAIEDVLDYEEIPAAMARGGKEFFALQIHGDSMEPVYLDGDVVILSKSDTCESGQDCAVRINGDEATFKRVRRSLGGIVLQPLNSDYAPLVYTNAQIAALPVDIVGVAVEIRRKL